VKIVQFEDLIGWQKAQDLAVLIYGLFQELKEYGFKDQIFRASVSVSNNVAEGFERGSDADFSRFLFISKGSNGEVKSMLCLAKRLNFISENDLKFGLSMCNEIGKILNGLLKSLKK